MQSVTYPWDSSVVSGSSSVSQCEGDDPVVKEIIHAPAIPWIITRNRIGVGLVNVAQAAAGNQSPKSGGDDDVVREQRAILEPDAEVETEFTVNLVSQERGFNGVGFDEVDVVHVDETAELRRDFDFCSNAEEQEARIHEIGLAFGFAAAQIRHEAVALLQTHRRTREIKSLPHVPTERPAREIGIVEDRVEAIAFAVLSVAVARSVKERRFEANPIPVVRKFQGRHLRIDVHRSP